MQSAFLDAFAKLGTILRAAQAVNINRQRHQEWMKQDAVYAERFQQAGVQFIESLEHEVFRRGVVGVDEPVVYQGKIMTDPQTGKPVTVKRYSDNLLMFKLKKENPAYRDSVEIGGINGGPIPLDIGIDRGVEALLSGLARLAARIRTPATALPAQQAGPS